jgi:hypothetical protein
MGTPSEGKFMNNMEIMVEHSLEYRNIIHDYWTLASRPTLTESEADRLEQILHKAQSEPLLEFLLDEIDHILAHELGLLDEQFIKHQQDELRKAIDQAWCEQVLLEIRNRSKAIQTYLKGKGFYTGAIDGQIGPRTQEAIALLKKEANLKFERLEFFDVETWSIC